MGVKSVETVRIVAKTNGKMSNVFHREAESKIQLFVRLAVCFQDKAVAQAISPLGCHTFFFFFFTVEERVPQRPG